MNLAKVTDFNRDFAVSSARFSKMIGRIIVVQGLTDLEFYQTTN